MPYTLMKGLVWILLAVALGIVIGWLLRSVAAKRQIERAKQGRTDDTDQEEIEALRTQVAETESVTVELDRLRAELDRVERPAAAKAPVPSGRTDVLVDATEILGEPVVRDDLTVIDGIGPKIADLCHGIGIRSWADLAATEVSLLRTMLNDAGQRFKAHDPSTWPDQAALLAAGSWREFKASTEHTEGGRSAD